ncbi:DUF1488 family protein [Pseudomonas neuropathica]
MKIKFPNHFTATLEGVSFLAKVDGQNFTCIVSTEALQDINPSRAGDSREQQYLDNRYNLEAIATKKIMGGDSSPIYIRTLDL